MNEPESAAVSVCAASVAPEMSTQVPVVGLHRRHWKANEVGLSVQVPVVAVSTAPGPTTPSTTGPAVTIGAPGGPTTNLVDTELAVADPSPFRIETVTRIDDARSLSTSVYVAAVAPGIGVHPVLGSTQRSHW